jgi:hypothetical protein
LHELIESRVQLLSGDQKALLVPNSTKAVARLPRHP